MLLPERVELGGAVVVQQLLVLVPDFSGDAFALGRISAAQKATPAPSTPANVPTSINVLILRKILCGGVRHDLDNLLDGGIELGPVDIFVEGVGVVVARGKIYRRHAKLRGDNRNVTERTEVRHETLAGDILLKLLVSALVVNCILLAFAVDFHEHL